MSRNCLTADIPAGCLTKTFSSPIACDMEAYVLAAVSGQGVAPQIWSCRDQVLARDYIPAVTALSLLEQAAVSRDRLLLARIMERLTDWMYRFDHAFYQATGRIAVLDDLHLKNILVTPEERLYGIDFESWHYGAMGDNAALLVAVGGSYGFDDPQWSAAAAMAAAEYCARCYGVDGGELLRQAEGLRSHIVARRSLRKLRRDTTAVILAGGLASRLNGVPKQHLRLGRYTFLQHICYALADFDHIAVSVAEPQLCRERSVLLWPDSFPGCGPAGGLATALEQAKTPLVLLIPCDAPYISGAMLQYLLSMLRPQDDCLVAMEDGRMHPTCGIYRSSFAPFFREQVEAGRLKMQGLLAELSTRYVELPSSFQGCLLNINTPELYCRQAQHPARLNSLAAVSLLPEQEERVCRETV